MIAGSVRKISLVALLVATAALLVPGAANAAAPRVLCVVAYGHENPGNCDPQPDLNVPPYAGRIYPTSQPYGYGEKGLLFVEGHTNAGAAVAVSATDGSRTYSRTVNATGAGEFKADLKVTNLGVHAGTGGAACNGIVSVACNGISTLTVSVVATVAGVDSAAVTTSIAKYAIKPGDQGLTGKDQYAPQWVAPRSCGTNCTQPNPEFPPGFWFQSDLIILCGNADCTSIGEAIIRGHVEDDTANAFGHASEIASVNVTITRAGVLVRDFGNVANRVNSTQAKFDIVLKAGDFEPTFPMSFLNDDWYTVTVEIKDANGNSLSASSDFDVMPV